MEHCFLDDLAALQMLNDNSLQQPSGDAAVPNAFGINDNYGPPFANAEARSLTALYSSRTK